MPGVLEQELSIARVYATAMLDIAAARGQMELLRDELTQLASQVEATPDLAAFFVSPMVDASARAKMIEKLFRGNASDLFVDSLQVLNRKGRLSLIRAVAETYRLAVEERQGRVEVHVHTAIPLTNELRRQLKDVADAHTGRQADLIETVDESLLGGLIVRIGDEKFDASVATRLKRLARAMLDRASREIHDRRAYVEPMPI